MLSVDTGVESDQAFLGQVGLFGTVGVVGVVVVPRAVYMIPQCTRVRPFNNGLFRLL